MTRVIPRKMMTIRMLIQILFYRMKKVLTVDGDENDSDVTVSDEELEHELKLDNVLDQGQQRRLPAYISGKLRKPEAGPPYFWSTTEPPQNVRTPAANIIRGGLSAQSRVLGFESDQ